MANSGFQSQSPLSWNSGSSSNSRLPTNEHGLVCGHGLPAKLCISRATRKRFYGCPKWPATCGYIVFEEDLVAGGNCSNCANYQAHLIEKEKKIAELVNEISNWSQKKSKWKARKTDLEGKLKAMESELSFTHNQLQQVVWREKYASILVICALVAAVVISLFFKVSS